MRLRTRSALTLAVFGVALVPIAASLVVTARQVAKVQERQAHGFALELGARELSYLSNDYLLNRESQQRARWEAKFAALSEHLRLLQPDAPEQRALADALGAAHRRLGAVFADVASTLGDPARFGGGAEVMDFVRVAWSRMEVQNQEAAFYASRLSRLLENEVDALRRRNVTLIFVLAGACLLFLAVNYTLVQRSVLQGIAELQVGTGIVGAGNLGYVIETQRSDEIGELARSFNRMTASLREVTASKADLEREIAERKKAEAELVELTTDIALQNRELEATNRDLESFVSTVSHDLRQPLRAMHSFAQLLTREYSARLNERGRDYLGRICRGTEKMGLLIEDLLGLARVSRQELQRAEVDVSAAAAAAIAELRERDPGREVEILVQPGMTAVADPHLLGIALGNLLDNAWKFTADREPARIELTAEEREGKTVFCLRDNGAGFDPALAGKAFRPFQRLHGAGEFAGTGIGLTIVERVVQRHGGSIRIEGEPGKGAAVHFTLG